ncbi:putative SOS response-associated peptidase YedK [Sphingomonas endophytica]|uniref:SOS response-associated peptidase YedK n=1 Tax=Sphingomonas endophytica TaxID=869719 RepID=A0ABR6N9R8_9SPHN|nr:putative SOS response-associated peptidase YedK [Sphingomonas endophytica]
MPLILHEEDEKRWLTGDLDDLVAPFPAQLMTVSAPEYVKGAPTSLL